ncbi:hypothetical protein ABQZ69_19335, partial [Xanthomonas sp. WHRI 8391]|uniref:hypothetical protein n=1 Tax=Xanthomonas sp. WHRI 8391 TaxID=3161573 RepID=UPI0032E9015A
MVSVHVCKQGMTRVVWITVHPISFATQRDQQAGFQQAADSLSGAVSSPLAGPCGGMDAATEPTWTY